ncbi:hypothetical protein Syun_024683 [Stephania yunnanensis]|uniref:Uncharacterized protein n=1 Tax=Stephania yunnanensis TaxID=152371 RepID=A0AAP0EVV8_9MAGN
MSKPLLELPTKEVLDMLRRSVKVVVGDVGDPSALKPAVEGCNKIIYCATARSTITGDLLRLDHQGVYNVSKAFQDYNNRLAQLRVGKSIAMQSSNLLNLWMVGKFARELTCRM